MLMPSIFGESFVDDFFGYPTRKYGYQENNNLMKTDIKETEKDFTLEISLPGFKRDEISAELKDGYLTIKAETSKNTDEKSEETGRYIRRERYFGSCSRSFYVGKDVTQEDIKAKYENGVLSMTVPKVESKPQVEEQHFIAIE